MRHKKRIALLCAAAMLLSGCLKLPGEKDLTYSDTLFDTVIRVQILDPAEPEVIDGVKKLCKYYDTLFSKTSHFDIIEKRNLLW